MSRTHTRWCHSFRRAGIGIVTLDITFEASHTSQCLILFCSSRIKEKDRLGKSSNSSSKKERGLTKVTFSRGKIKIQFHILDGSIKNSTYIFRKGSIIIPELGFNTIFSLYRTILSFKDQFVDILLLFSKNTEALSSIIQV
jgi:hypothetical protein